MLERRSRKQPAHEFLIVGLQVKRDIRDHPEFAAGQIECAGLLHVPRDPVQDKPPSCLLGGDQFLPHHVKDDLVGHEFAAVEIFLNG